jgi:L-ascorbate metabolism protein UlaG (beta-lactamase superfamily)
MDLPTLLHLRHVHSPRFYVGLGNQRYLNGRGLDDVTELDWWESAPLGDGAQITFTPAQHWSSRGPTDRHRTLWGGFVVTTQAGSMFFAGDTGYAAHFRKIRERLGSPRLALLPIGAYEPRWFMSQMHTAPDEAVQAHLDLGAQTSLAIHFGAFLVSDEAQDQPPRDLRAALAAAGLPDDCFWILAPGESRAAPAIDKSAIQSERGGRRTDRGAAAAGSVR